MTKAGDGGAEGPGGLRQFADPASLTATYVAGPIIETRDQLYAPLLACYRSLCDVGLDTIANGVLLDTLRRVAVFGVTLTKLSKQQADYIGVTPDGPFKPDTYRY